MLLSHLVDAWLDVIGDYFAATWSLKVGSIWL